MSTVTSYWLAFFRDTGLPENISTKYAVLFSNERIDPSMLGELSKDILKDIGITAMGDIIAILRHARVTLDKNTQDKTLEGVMRATPAGRTIAHYVGNSKRKDVVKLGGSNSPKVDSTPPPPLPLRRRVTKEIEGSYKVIMPKGTTPKTRAILQAIEESKKAKSQSMVADKASTNRSVFDRLAVNNPSDKPAPKSSSGVRMQSSTSHEDQVSSNQSNKSVFRRLGPHLQPPKPATESSQVTEYAGIFKITAGSKRRAVERNSPDVSSATTEKRMRLSGNSSSGRSNVVRAEATSTTWTKSEGIFSKMGTGNSNVSVRERLGGKKFTMTSAGDRTRLARPQTTPITQEKPSGIKARLGARAGNVDAARW